MYNSLHINNKSNLNSRNNVLFAKQRENSSGAVMTIVFINSKAWYRVVIYPNISSKSKTTLTRDRGQTCLSYVAASSHSVFKRSQQHSKTLNKK